MREDKAIKPSQFIHGSGLKAGILGPIPDPSQRNHENQLRYPAMRASPIGYSSFPPGRRGVSYISEFWPAQWPLGLPIPADAPPLGKPDAGGALLAGGAGLPMEPPPQLPRPMGGETEGGAYMVRLLLPVLGDAGRGIAASYPLAWPIDGATGRSLWDNNPEPVRDCWL